MKCGLLGEKLSHSYSPQIHAALGDYEYRLYEKSPDEVETFVRYGDWHGLNVTIPYKKTVIPFCDELTDIARAIGSVNTLLRCPDGRILGDNTDAYGFDTLLNSLSFDPKGKKALVLGTGGASATVCACLARRGAEVLTVSRTAPSTAASDFSASNAPLSISYTDAAAHSDAALVVNTTPLGMYPKNGAQALSLELFPRLEAVLDVVYNPARTALLLQAEELGVPCAGGLRMLVAQGVRASEIFLGAPHPKEALEEIFSRLSFEMQNIILIGMPGSGKSTIAALLAGKLGRPWAEADEELVKAAGRDIPTIFAEEGEEGFRRRETEILTELGKSSGLVLSTGGGCVTRLENYSLLHQNGVIVRIVRDISRLAREGRPLSLNTDLSEMARARDPLYARFADFTVSNDGTPEETVKAILEVLQ